MLVCNGQPATPDDLAALALTNYGHFTTLQVRGGAAVGLDLHIQRLRQANLALFGRPISEQRLRSEMRKGLEIAQRRDASLRLTLFCRELSLAQLRPEAETDVLVSVGPPGEVAGAALRLRSSRFARHLPHYKQVGIFPLIHEKRLAIEAGYDDVLFVDEQGRLLEGSFWNVGLWDGNRVIWPQGPALPGTQRQLLQAGLTELGIRQQSRPVKLGEVSQRWAMFTCNSRGQQPVAMLDDRPLAQAPELPALLNEALTSQPWQAL